MTTATASAATPFDPTTFDPGTFNPLAPGFLADPYPTYAWFREHAPVCQVKIGANDTAYWVFGDADARAVLTQGDRFQKLQYQPTPQSVSPFDALNLLPTGIMNANAPRHTELRRWVEPIFDRALGAAPATSAAVMTSLIGKLAGTRRFELIQDIALPLPASVLYELLGFTGSPVAGPVLTGWITAILAAHNAAATPSVSVGGGTSALALLTYFDGLMALHIDHGQPVPGVFGAVAESVKNGEMGRADAIAVMDNLTIAGYITTTFLIGSGINNLLRAPEQLAALRNDPTLIGPAIEEMLRFDAPAQIVSRVTAEQVELSGVTLPPNTRVNIVLGSANRDPATYPNPDTFDITREDPTQLAFGGGIHECIGAPLARITAPAAITALLALDDLRIDGTPQWQTDPYLRGITSLPMAYGR